MASIGNWLPRRTPTSDSRNQQQQQSQQMNYGQNQSQQEPSRQSSQVQSLNRSIYSVVEPSGTRKTPQTNYNGLIVDSGLQGVGQSVPPRTSHSFEQQPGRGQSHAPTPLGSHQAFLVNGHLRADQAQSSRLQQPQHAGHDGSRQSQVGAQDIMLQSMTTVGSHSSPIDGTRQVSGNGMVSATGLRQSSAQHYPQYQQQPQLQQQLQQPQHPQSHTSFNQTSWNVANATRRPSNDHPQMKSDKRPATAYAPVPSRTDISYSIPSAEGRQHASRSSGQNQVQSLAGNSPVNAITNMTQSENSGSHTGPMSAPLSGGEVTSSPQWQITHLSSRIDQLAKTQADMLAYLHVELTRRKEWEEQLLKELRQRGESVKPMQGDMTGVAAPQDPRWNSVGRSSFAGNPLEMAGNGSYPSANPGSMPNLQNGYAAWTHSQNPTQVTSNGNAQVFGGPALSDATKAASDATSFFPAQQLHPRDRSDVSMGTTLANGYLQGTAQTQEQDNGALTSLPLQKPVDISQTLSQQVDPTQTALACLPALPLYVEPETMSAPAVIEDAEPTKRKRKAEGDANTERPSKKLEVDERGVVIMMSGSTKLKERPTKIQSVVRKTLYGSMGIPELADAKDMPIYQEGMDPPDGSKIWRFGNLRFDWNATLRRSVHNVAMRDIVLKHIISLRAEYAEIPDSEFEPVRLEPAFDQAFGTWKGKFQGKRPGGIRRGMGLEKNSPKPNQSGQTEKSGEGELERAGTTLE